ncbi:LysE family transporter [Oerskovia flava]|uniref:LysE family transporter n=1 Tax=Oerskovia flava TaxID=2986422 RepID=UPI002240427E|nr:LysE family transporter [Oerskovia sp. JB1-3-2]
MEHLPVLVAGLVAGLGVAVPLGAIGVLLVQEGASRGRAGGAPAAVAVASVDLLYCVAAVLGGSAAAPVVATWGPWPQVVGGAALVAIAAVGLVRSRRTAPGAARETTAGRGSSWRRYALFFGLTAINPATLVYFAAIVTGLSSITTSAEAAAAFVVGVGLASLGWQLLLVVAGAFLHGRAGPRLHAVTSLVGNGVVGVLGVSMIGAGLLG